MWVPFCIFLRDPIKDSIQIIFIMLNVVKDVGQVGNHEIILIGNHEIKRQRICHDVKTANFNSCEFKWGYRFTVIYMEKIWYFYEEISPDQRKQAR